MKCKFCGDETNEHCLECGIVVCFKCKSEAIYLSRGTDLRKDVCPYCAKIICESCNKEITDRYEEVLFCADCQTPVCGDCAVTLEEDPDDIFCADCGSVWANIYNS